MPSQAPPIRDPETRDEVARLESALTLICPGGRVDSDHAGPDSAWVQRITIPLRNGTKMVVTSEIDGWQATLYGGYAPACGTPIQHVNRQSLIEATRDAVVCALATRAT